MHKSHRHYFEQREVRNERMLLYESNLYEVQGQVILIIMVIAARIEITWQKGMVSTVKEHEKSCQGSRKVPG